MTHATHGDEVRLGVTRMDARGRIYLRHLFGKSDDEAIYAVYVDRPDGEDVGAAPKAPKTIRMRLVE